MVCVLRPWDFKKTSLPCPVSQGLDLLVYRDLSFHGNFAGFPIKNSSHYQTDCPVILWVHHQQVTFLVPSFQHLPSRAAQTPQDLSSAHKLQPFLLPGLLGCCTNRLCLCIAFHPPWATTPTLHPETSSSSVTGSWHFLVVKGSQFVPRSLSERPEVGQGKPAEA